jgi:hypothetical protein
MRTGIALAAISAQTQNRQYHQTQPPSRLTRERTRTSRLQSEPKRKDEMVQKQETKCDLEYIGRIGSQPNQKIWRCNTHPHNFFFNETDEQLAPERCDKAPETPTFSA